LYFVNFHYLKEVEMAAEKKTKPAAKKAAAAKPAAKKAVAKPAAKKAAPAAKKAVAAKKPAVKKAVAKPAAKKAVAAKKPVVKKAADRGNGRGRNLDNVRLFFFANSLACTRGMIPSCSPLSPTRRTSLAIIRSLTRSCLIIALSYLLRLQVSYEQKLYHILMVEINSPGAGGGKSL